MQIMPSGGAWTNPAAFNQQALSDSKQSGAIKTAVSATEPVNPLEQTGKASDRDADERYDRPQQSAKPSSSTENNAVIETESMLSLPANDDLGEASLDLLG